MNLTSRKISAAIVPLAFACMFVGWYWLKSSIERKHAKLTRVFTACLVDHRPQPDYSIRASVLLHCRDEAAAVDSEMADAMAGCVSSRGEPAGDAYVLSPKQMTDCIGGSGW